MSSRARRIGGEPARPFTWMPEVEGASIDGAAGAALDPPAVDPAAQQAQLAGLEREAFTKGYAQGERAGLEAGAKRAEAMLRRLADTLGELATLKKTMVHQTDRQIVQLAVAMARRIVRREVNLDHDVMVTMARVALERLGEGTPATIRLNPDDHATIVARRGDAWGAQVAIVADPAVARGGCLVESEFGSIDAGADAQLEELARALLVDEELPPGDALDRAA